MDSIQEAINNYKDAISSNNDEKFSKINEILNTLSERLEGVNAQHRDIINNNIEQSNELKEAIELVKDNITRLQNNSINNNSTLNNNIKGMLDEISETILSAKNDIINNDINSNTSSNNEIKELLSTLADNYEGLKDNLLNSSNSLNNTINTTVNNLSENINTIKQDLLANSNINNSYLEESLTSAVHATEANLVHRFEEVLNKINDSNNGIIEQMQSITIKEYIDALKTDLESLNAEISQSINASNSMRNAKIQEIHSNIDSSKDYIINKISDTVVDNINSIEGFVSSSTSSIENSIKEHLNSTFVEVNDSVNKILEAVEATGDNKTEQTQDIIQKVRNILSSFQAAIEASNNSIMNVSQESMNSLALSIDSIIQEFTGLSVELKDSALENKSEIINKINAVIPALSDNYEDLRVFVKNELSDIISKFSQLTSSIEVSEQAILQKIEDSAISTQDRISGVIDKISDIKSGIEHSSVGIHDNINFKFEELIKRLQELEANDLSVSKENYNNISSKIIGLENAIEAIGQKQDSQKSDLFDEILNYIDEIKRIVESSDSKINESIQALKSESVAVLNNSQNIISNTLRDIKEESANQFKDLLTNLDDIKATLSSKDEIDDKFNQVEGTLINVSRELNTLNATNLTAEDLASLKSEISNIQDALKDYISTNSTERSCSIINDLSNKLDEISNIIKDSIEAKSNKEESLIKASVENMESRFNDVYSTLANIINDIDNVRGIVSSDADIVKLTEKLNDIQAEFVDVNANIKNSESDNVAQISSLNTSLKTKLSDVEAIIQKSVSEKSEELASLINNLQNTVKQLDENIDEDTTRQLNIVQEELSSVSSALFTNTDKLTLASKLHFDEVFERFVHSEELLKALKLEFNEAFASNIEEVKAEFNNLNQIFDKTEDLKGQITSLNNILKSYFENIVEQIEKYSSQEQVDVCINKLETVENKLDKLDFSSQNAENADKIIMSNIESIEQKVDSISSNVDSLTRNTLAEQLDEIKGVVFEQRERLKALSTTDDLTRLPNIEEINNVVQTNTADLLNDFNKKLDETSVETLLSEEMAKLKSDLLSQTVKILDQISFEVEEAEIIDSIQENTNTIKSDIAESKSDILSKLTSNKAEIISSLADKNDVDAINQKLEDLSDTYEMEKGFADINSRIDSLVNTSITNGFENIQTKIDNSIDKTITEGLENVETSIQDGINDIQDKLDSVVDNSLEKGFEDVKSKIDSVTDNTIKKELNEVKSQLETVANNDELQKEFEEVKKHLLTIQSGDCKANYTYSLQDVESDIAKLRIAMKELQAVAPDEELEDIRKKVDDIVLVVDSIKNQISQAEIDEIGASVEKMNEDVVSISTRTNKLLLTSENSANLLKENLESFRLVVNDIDERTRNLAESYDLTDVHSSISSIQNALIENSRHSNVVNQSLVAIAEWVDCAGATLSSISEKVEKIDDIEDIKSLIRNIEMPDRFDYSVFDSIEEKFNVQQDKIDMLEDKINKLTELVEANDNTQITKKISSVDRQLAKLNKSIERLTSYVDEE